jgi:SAM-dependent methyltransferase
LREIRDRRSSAFQSVEPLSYLWGTDRGLPPHRYYVEEFLRGARDEIRGHCLEFREDRYTTRFGEGRPERLDILHIDSSNEKATLIADLTRPNRLSSDMFDCIICTFVLHVVTDPGTVFAEMHRMLKTGGVLLIAVPQVSMDGPEYGELWRFTQAGLRLLLGHCFPSDGIVVKSFENALTTAGDLRGIWLLARWHGSRS